MQIVTPKGIVDANANENTDLFIAIRGGQGNFGIVTRFDIRTHERSAYWGGGILYLDTTEDAQLQAWADLKNGEYDPHAAVVQSYLYFGAQKQFMISNNMVYLQQKEKPEGLAGFENIGDQVQGTNTMRLDTTKNFALELQAWQPLDQ
jgi:FAD/FMN-containing dehydrogenase